MPNTYAQLFHLSTCNDVQKEYVQLFHTLVYLGCTSSSHLWGRKTPKVAPRLVHGPAVRLCVVCLSATELVAKLTARRELCPLCEFIGAWQVACGKTLLQCARGQPDFRHQSKQHASCVQPSTVAFRALIAPSIPLPTSVLTCCLRSARQDSQPKT